MTVPRQPAFATLLVAAAFSVACGARGADAPSDSNAAASPSETAWGEATVVEELRIGIEYGADEYMIGAVRGMAVADDGTIYVADSQPTRVRMYDREGAFVRDIGREGQGPGEYAYTPALQVLPDGRLATWDYGTGRVSLFSAAGDYLESFPAVPGTNRMSVDVEGNLYVHGFRPVPGMEQIELVKYSADGEQLGRVSIPNDEPEGRGFYLDPEGGLYPFLVMTRSTWSPLGYVVTGRNDVYDIELRKPEGSVHLRRDVAPAAVEPEERDEWEAFRQLVLEMQRARNAEYPIVPIAAVKPFFREIYSGQDGRIWVLRYVAAEKRDDVQPVPGRPDRPLLTWREPWTYDVFEPDGTFLGTVVIRQYLRPYVFRGEQIWGVHSDDDGVERVVRLSVIPEVR